MSGGGGAGMTGSGDRYTIVDTSSGARAVRDELSGEVMHPMLGAAEAEQLYVAQSGLFGQLTKSSGGTVTLFDVGLGAGSNALAARRVAESQPGPQPASVLDLVSFERDLSPLELALREPASFGLEGEPGEAARALLAHGRHETPRTRWTLLHGDVLASLGQLTKSADLVFWDPYSPRMNPGLWTVGAFSALRARCAANATVFTYSASTTTRAAMLLAGFAVGIGEGTGRQRQTTVAAMSRAALAQPLGARFWERLERSTAPLPSDAPPDARERLRAALLG